MYNVWTFLKQKDQNTFVLEEEVRLDHRVWSLHELMELFERTGWRYKAVYPGFSVAFEPEGASIQEEDLLKTRRFLVISYRPEIE